jgi:hypothetical protein
LSDGTPLSFVLNAREEATVISAKPYVEQPAQQKQSTNSIFAYLAVGVLSLLIGGAVIVWLKSDSIVSSNNKNEAIYTVSNSTETKPNDEKEFLNSQKAELQEEQAKLEKEKQQLAEERRKLEARKNETAETTAFNRTTSDVQPTERIKFRRGSVEETISGRIGSKRNYVLRTRNGQYLQATLNSSGSCVVFDNGSQNTSYTTISGDSYLNLVNNCRTETNFSLTVNVR